MILVPQEPDGLNAILPQTRRSNATLPPPEAPVILVVQSHATSEPTYSINEQPMSKPALVATLTAMYAGRSDRSLFVKGDADLEFNTIAEVISLAHRARIENIGVLTQKGSGGM